VLGYYTSGDGGGGEFYWDDSSVETDNGGTIIAVIGVATGRWKRVISGIINVRSFGAKGDGVTNDTTKIQSALDFADTFTSNISPSGINGDIEVVFPKGLYLVTLITAGVRANIRFTGGVLQPFEYVTTRTHLLKVNGHSKIINPTIWMNYATNYDSAIYIRGRYNEIINPEIWAAKCAFIIGDPAWEGVAASGALGDSENVISGGKTVWCITVAKGYGQNTIVSFCNGFLGYSYKYSLEIGDPRKTAWEAQSEISFINCGGFFYFTGCVLANFTGSYPLMQSRIQIVSAVDYVNSYGKFILSGTHLETGYIFEVASAGAVPIQDDITNIISMSSCNGYIASGRAGYVLEGGSTKQSINIDNSCNFYGNTGSTVCSLLTGKSHIGIGSFNNLSVDFFQSLNILMPTGYDNFLMLNATTSNQNILSALTTLKPTTIDTCDVNSSNASTLFNTSTGVFTCPTNMREVTVFVRMAYTGSASTDENDVYIFAVRLNLLNIFFKVSS